MRCRQSNLLTKDVAYPVPSIPRLGVTHHDRCGIRADSAVLTTHCYAPLNRRYRRYVHCFNRNAYLFTVPVHLVYVMLWGLATKS